ncbi:MAG: AtpZ/AtpI family protein [Nitrospirae bacterium]|nr:AtpZ/AtpI family protein [Nitrospirota bacterium]
MEEKEKEFLRNLYTLASVGINIVVATFIGLIMGRLLDVNVFKGKTEPWFTLIFLLFGIIAGFRNVFQMVREKGSKNIGPDGGGDASEYDSRGDEDDDRPRT